MPHTKKHSKQKTQVKDQPKSILGTIWSYTKTIAGYISLTNLVKILAISSAATHVAGAQASQCQTHMQIPFSCSYPVIHPLNPENDVYVFGMVPEKNFTTSQILCKFSTDYPGSGGVDFTFEPPSPSCQLKQDGSCSIPFKTIIHKGEDLSLLTPSFSTEGKRRPAEIGVLFPQCDYHEEECQETASSLFISCSPQ